MVAATPVNRLPDQATAKVLRGVILAQAMTFRTGRGRFNAESLRAIQRLAAQADPLGLPSHFQHAQPGQPDQLGKFLGRLRNPRIADGGAAVVADLYFDATSLKSPPNGGTPLGLYVMELAASDPAALAMSLVLTVSRIQERDSRGRVIVDENDEPLAPIWSPLSLSGADCVSRGDAALRLLLSAPADDDAALRARNAARKAAWAREEAQQEAEDIRLRWEWKNKKRRLGLA
jgi:hypothetical protein